MNDENTLLLPSRKLTTSLRDYSSIQIFKEENDEKDDDTESTSGSLSMESSEGLNTDQHVEDDADYDIIFSSDMDSINEERRDDIENHFENDDADVVIIDIEDAINKIGMGIFQYQIILACGLCFASDAMEVLLLSFLGVILKSIWSLSEAEENSIVSVVFAGAMLGTLVLSPLGDRIGRRPVFALTAVMISVFGVLTAFCTNYPQILLARFFVGFAIGGLTVPYDALGEFMPSSYRGKRLISTSFFWTAGSLLVPFFAWLTLGGNANDMDDNNNIESDETFDSEEVSWRAFVALCALPSIVSTVLGVLLVPESPRWLLTRGKHDQALRILRQAAAKNGRDPLLAFPERTRLVDTDSSRFTGSDINEDSRQRESQISDDTNGTHTSKSFCYLVCNREWRKMGLLLGGQWYGQAFMYYGAIMAVSIVFSDVSSNPNDNTTNADDIYSDDSNGRSFDFDYGAIFITSSAEIVGLIIAILMVDRLGRVPTQTWFYFLGGLCILILGLLDFYVGGDAIVQHKLRRDTEDQDQQEIAEVEKQNNQRLHLIFFAFLSKMFIMAATSVTWLHTAELLPTKIRATGHGLGKFLFLIKKNG
ncbi:MAG: MFS family permease [Bacillariaceae sp.]|jgi:MFS family permease